ncbi:4-(cytidine 5'-diphospho)-2-C-methyl-D-erythritol kinase [Psychromicrobium xiongbiense]|uniref:4-(cytidine 5'-diphospho)-2-C-methyl-D-erythritol kinase n=1 Tax=Psychromicrobium xiongbiense TaxID=3051184 RepID=UPI002553F501|nr:4-(cytidine 5'-diphospho)-2-C-methyl-D-erythritol kinase [Psychromicrobium sp. YIM S02556]
MTPSRAGSNGTVSLGSRSQDSGSRGPGKARQRSVRAKAPGKINVSFEVGPLREDGYHPVASAYLAVSLYEEVTVRSRLEPGVGVSLRYAPDGLAAGPASSDSSGSSGSDSSAGPEEQALLSIPLDHNNLVARAANLMADLSEHPTGVDIEILKRVPVAGGMGGGSADAAATLLACDALWEAGLSREELAHLAAELGADVPFALFGGAAIGLGVGEELSSALAPRPFFWVLAAADFGLSTPSVFGTLDKLRTMHGERPEVPQAVNPLVLQALRSGDAEALAAVVHNDLEPAALSLSPGLAGTLRAARDAGALAAVVSGSGPTVAALARDQVHAEDIADELRAGGLRVRAVHSPVHGAKIVSDVVH